MKRLHQFLLIGSLLPLAWLAMMAVHEFGHVLGAWLTGGSVARVVLDPTTISRTDLANNPRPLVVSWAGPVVGSLLPLLVWALALWRRLAIGYLLRFFAGFCLIANGAYIGCGSFDKIGDAGDLLRHGAAHWQLWAFGVIGSISGLLLWHRSGTNFGFGAAQGQVDRRAAIGCSGLLLVVVALELWLGGD